MIAYSSTMHAQSGKRTELLALLQELVDVAIADEPDTVVSYELFADDAAFAVHRDSATVARILPRLRELTTPGSLRRLDPTIGKGC